ncbi:MAG: 3-deoxy-D-manno-octulosonic acid transferase [Nitrospiraceae bacterium]|nr:3-deoxy-D-manno-octulosonic acid transferase [Nitrospiraceae bacterium]
MIQLIYSFIYSLALIFFIPFEYAKRSRGIRRRWLREKFGFISFNHNSNLVWIHAVSIGEILAAVPLIQKLKERFPYINIVVSTITDTGQKIASEKVPAGTQVIYMPFDLKFVLKRTLKKTRPVLFITMETELWPNILLFFKKQNIPAIIMNGRISEKSFDGYMKIRFFMKKIIRSIDLFCMQDSVYAKRIKALGASEDRIKIPGNFKFDTKPSENLLPWTRLLPSPVIIAGSTHKGEEELILSVYKKLVSDIPELNLIIAPRHPARFREAEELVKEKKINCIKRTDMDRLDAASKIKGHVVILDAVGELSSVYAIADIAIIGGSFIDHGGQNLLEPAFWAKPIVCGPSTHNFPFTKEFYKKKAAIEASRTDLYEKLKELLSSPEKRNAFGSKAKELYNEKAGAVDRAVSEIKKYIRN